MSKKPYTSLTFEKRQIIENMAKKKQTPQRIAEATGVHVATIYRQKTDTVQSKHNVKF